MATCVLPGRPHQAAAGLLICQHHLDEIGKWLIDVEDEVAALDARPSMAIRWDHGGGGLAFEQAPARINVIVHGDHRHVADEDVDHPAGFDVQGVLSAFETLHRYAQRVRDERLLVAPTVTWIERVPYLLGPFCHEYWADTGPLGCGHGSCEAMRWRRERPAPLDVASERAVLSRQLTEWIAYQPWVADLYLELRRLREQLQAANGTSDPKPLPGRCPRLDPAGNDCGGHLWPVKPVHSTGTFITTDTDSVYAVQCERDREHHWEGRDLIRLSLILDQNKET